MATSHEENWLTATNPRHLLRLSRVRPNGRKYLLLACATARHLAPHARTEIGVRILDALERFAAVQPARGVTTHLWRDVVRRRVPEIPDSIPNNVPQFGTDTAWVRQFAGRLQSLSQVHTAEVNVVFDLILAPYSPLRSEAREEAHREAQALASELALGTPTPPAGWFARLLGRAAGRAPQAASDAERFRDAVLARLPPGKQEQVRAEWPTAHSGASAWQQGLTYLINERVEQRFAEANARACGLVREVFGNPFRPPPVDPAWLAWNHGAVRHIAERIAATGDFGDLPILGDALEDAGCGDEELLRHCRAGQEEVPSCPHVPGCWAVDAVLGRN